MKCWKDHILKNGNQMFVNKIISLLIILYLYFPIYIYIIRYISFVFIVTIHPSDDTHVMTPGWWHTLADDSLLGDDDNTRVAEVGLKRFELGAILWAAEDRRKRQKTAGAGHESVSI